MTAAAAFAVTFPAYLAGHYAGDYWVQTSAQAARKGLPGRAGHRACLAHVAAYTLTLAAFLALAETVPGLTVSTWHEAAGLAVSAVTHYFADRRTPLRKLAAALGKGEFWDSGQGLASGAAHLDQAWHLAWIFIAALITTR